MAKKVLFINQEIAPYVPETTMAALGRDLPSIIQEGGFEIRTFMPKWGNINERRGQLHEVIRLSGMNIIIDDQDHQLLIKVASIPSTHVQVYFIDNDDYFMKREMLIDPEGKPYADNGERALFYSRGVIETVKKLRWAPDVIHCQGWMSSMAPLYIRKVYEKEPVFANTKIVTSLFGEGLEGALEDKFKKNMELKGVKAKTLQPYAKTFDLVELGKLAIDYSDAVVAADDTVSSQLIDYAKAKGVPFLPYPGKDAKEAYRQFYTQCFEQG